MSGWIITIIVCFLAGMGAGLGTGFAGMSAAAVITPMLVTFLGMPAYEAVGIALASDVLASAVSAYTYGKNKNLDIKNGLIMMVSVLVFTVVGSYVSKLVPNSAMGGFSVCMTFLLGYQVHSKAGYDHQGEDGERFSQEESYPVYCLRRAYRLYLRIYRCRRRNDDAPYPYKRSGL